MAEEIKIVAEPRTVVGKKVKQLRRVGLVPCVIYGLNDPINVQIAERVLYRTLRAAGATNVINIQIGDETHMVLAREIQSHLTRKDLLHVDFLEVDMDAVVTAMVELNIINSGKSKPVAEGLGLLVQDLREVEIEAKPADLLDSISVDASLIKKTNDVIHVSDLEVPAGITIVSDPELAIVRFDEFREDDTEKKGMEELGADTGEQAANEGTSAE